tara:strand:- start:14 stop:1237 length:1224 start_codon:yes stop_codon:yes gene_type:complete
MQSLSEKKIIFIILLGALLRIVSISLYGDEEVANEWGIMLENLEQYNMLSVRSIDGVPVPNIFMPPLYPLFLYLVKLVFNDSFVFLNAVFTTQLILSLISIFLAFKIFLEIFNEKYSQVGTLLYAIFPLNIFAVSQISSVSLQMLLINVFLLGYIKFFKNLTLKNIIFFSVPSALLILLRGEFFIFVLLSLAYLILKHKCFQKVIVSVFIIIFLISPYLYRNFNIFGTITITKSSGYNLLKGNHPLTAVEGVGMFNAVEKVIPQTTDKLKELYALGPIKKHDLLKDKILMDQAIEFIKEDPVKYVKLYFKKFFSFLFFDLNSTYPNYYSIFHIFPKVLLSISTIVGIIFTISMKKNISNYFILFYLSNIGLFSFFFILPRYSLSLLTIQILMSLYCIEKIKKKFNIL